MSEKPGFTDPSKIELLASVTRLLDSRRDIDDVLGKIIEAAIYMLGTKASSLMMIKDKRLRFFMATGDTKKKLHGLEVGMGEGIAGWVASNNRPLLVKNVEKDYRWSPKVAEITGYQARSIACAPLRIKEDVVGVLQILDRKDGSPLEEEDLERLVSFSLIAEILISEISQKRTIRAENEFLRKEIEARYRLVGESPNFLKVLKDADKLARTNTTCILTGESGTGKELLARHIHKMSDRALKPFIATNCGALPENILERELFGHEKGAFTGADRCQIGLFEAADNGIIFLDEVSEMPPAMQVKFLRVLQDHTFYRLGGTTQINVDVRIMAATNRDLERMVAEGQFREDLFYRLNIVRLEFPPLRERREDIPILVEHFLKNHNIVPLSRKIKVSPKAMEYLKNYSWPGNVRELENAIERALVMGEGSELMVEDFAQIQPTREKGGKMPVGSTLKSAMNEFKRSFLLKTLDHTSGNRTEAAKILDIKRTYLSKLIKEFDLYLN